MPPFVIDLRSADDARDVVHRAVQALAEGKLVAFPTETVYGLAASALSDAGVHRLLSVKGRDEGKPLTLAVKSADDALDYVPDMSPLARRLARRCWPGPITLVVQDNHADSLVKRLPLAVQQAVAPTGTIGLRVPAHPMVLDVMRMLAGPIVLSSANRSGQPDAVDAEGVLAGLGDDVQLVIDDGPSRYGQASSVVLVEGNRLKMLREGVVAEPTLRRLASFVVLFVCTGNTCRSPMAEVLFRQMAAERLKCDANELEDRGLIIMSAGISAMAGGPAAPEAVAVMSEFGLRLDEHSSQPLTEQLVRTADLMVTMTRSHRAAILAQWPEAAARVEVLRGDQGDIADPIGGPGEVYRRCADQLREELARLLDRLDVMQDS